VKNSDSQYVKIEQFKIRFGQKIANAFYISDVIDRITGDYTRSEGHSLTDMVLTWTGHCSPSEAIKRKFWRKQRNGGVRQVRCCPNL